MTLSVYNLKEKLKEKKPMIGTLHALPSPEVTEMLIDAGFQWLWVDMEHSPIGPSVMQHILQTAQKDCPCIVRAPSHDEVWFKKVLDAGADGIIVPQIKTAEDAKKLMKYCKYPPLGNRSVGLSRAHGYGNTFARYVANANNEIVVVLQVEHIDAVNNIEEILTVPGIDAIMIGPFDLSGSMGMIGQVNHPTVQEKVEIVRKTCLDAGMPLGIFTTNPDEVSTLKEKGYTLIAMGIDSMFLGQALQQSLERANSK